MLERFQAGEIPDIVTVRSWNDDLPALIEAGMLADVSGSSVIQNDVAGMYDCVKMLVIQPDGSIYGVPGFFCLENNNFVPSAWQRAGLDYNNRPTSFTGLLDLAEWWLESGGTRNGVCFLRLIEDETSHPYINWLLYCTVQGAAQACIDLLKRIDEREGINDVCWQDVWPLKRGVSYNMVIYKANIVK